MPWHKAAMADAITIYVDADACPVKDEVFRVAERHGAVHGDVAVQVVANAWLNVPRVPWITLTVVGSRLDEADDWIAERAKAGDIVITADVPLAARCVKAGAAVLAPNGKAFNGSIGMDLALRNLMTDLRAASPTERVGSGPRPFGAKDRSTFLQALHEAVVKLKRG